MRSGPLIMSPWLPRGVGKSCRRGGKWCEELFTERIGKDMSASNAANKRACLRFFPDGKSHRTSYEYWKLLEQMFPGADKFRTGSLWCLWAHTRASHWDNNCVTMCHNGGHNASLWCQWMLVKQIQHQGCVFFLICFCSIAIFYLFWSPWYRKTHSDSKIFDLFWFFYFDGCTNMFCLNFDGWTCIVWTNMFCQEMLCLALFAISVVVSHFIIILYWLFT